MRPIITALAVVLAFAACTDDDPEAIPPSPTPTETGLPAGWTTCTNDTVGYSIGYPDDWFTASTSAENECRWFNRTAFELREGSEAPTTDLIVVPIERSYDEQAPVIGAAPDERTISREETTVAGRDAIRFEIEQARDGFYPEGTIFFGFLVDGPAVALLVETIDIGGAPYHENKEIIRRAAATLAFPGQSG